MTATPARPSDSRSQRRRWLPYLLGAALLGLLVYGLQPRPAPVETARAVFGPLSANVSEEGKTRIRQRYVVSAPVSGQVRRLAFKPGAAVLAHETVVALIDPLPSSPLDPRTRTQAQARHAAATALLDKSRSAHELTRSELRRMERMFAAGTVSPQDLETAQLRETAAARDLAATEGELRQAEAALADAPLAAPSPVEVRALVSGTVLHVFQESARAVAQGTPLVEIGDPADLEVVVEMLSRDGAAIAPGARVELEQWGGPGPLAGRVRLVEPAAFTKISALGVEEQRVNVLVDLLTPLAERRTLGDNFRVEARVIVWEGERVLKVPASALFRRGTDWAAFVVRGGRAMLVPVQAGHGSGLETEVLGGLQEGDEVVLYPGDRVANGQRVRPMRI